MQANSPGQVVARLGKLLLSAEGIDSLMQSYPTRALDRRLQEDCARDAREGLRVLMSLRVDFGPMS